MRLRIAGIGMGLLVFVTGCGGGGVATTPVTPVATSAATSAVLPSASNSTCVAAQTTPQSVTLPDTGGITATLAFAQYDAGATGCQNITIATGAAAAAAVTATTSSSSRLAQATSPTPIVSMTLGQGLPTSLGLATVMSGATINTDPSLNFPDGTYDATVQIAAYGVSSSITVSLILTASNGKLTITGGTQLPLNLGSGAQLLIYNRGVVPPNFLATPAPSPSPSASGSPTASPTPSAAPTATIAPTPTPIPTPTPVPTLAPGAPVANGTTIGSFTAIIAGLPINVYGNGVTYSGPIVYGPDSATVNALQCVVNQQSGNAACTYTGTTFDASIPPGEGTLPGTVTYALGGLPAKSYRITGCTGAVGYGGSGVAGTFSTPYQNTPLTFGDNCEVDLYSQPANVINASADGGGEYLIYSVSGPVSTGQTTVNPAVNTQSVQRSH